MKITKSQLREIIKEEIRRERNAEEYMKLLAAAVGTARDQLKKSNRRRGDLQDEDVQSVLDQYKESFNKNIKDKTIKAKKLKDIEAAKEHVFKKGIPGNL